MMDWLAQHGPIITTLCFFAGFVGIALWAYAPANKKGMEERGNIPLRESIDDPR